MSAAPATAAARAVQGPAPDAGSCLDRPLDEHFAALPEAWQRPLQPWLAGPRRAALARFVDARRAAAVRIYPPRPLAALEACTPEEVRVVILGQDPYHGHGQAHGYAFSVPSGVRPPPSLRNIFAEIARDLGAGVADGPGGASAGAGRLLQWSSQGVLLLNAVLTVEEGAPGSHAGQGWEAFTEAVIACVAGTKQPKVFLLWGAQAQARRAAIEAAVADAARTRVLVANHPSPLSARRPPLPFIGCGHFSQANTFLRAHGQRPIRW